MKTYDISSWIAEKARRAPDKVAIRFEGRETRYGQFEDRIAHLSGAFADTLGIEQGDRIAFLGDNCPEILELLFACARTGAILVPLNIRMTTEQLGVFLNNAKPRYLFVCANHFDSAEACLQQYPSMRLIGIGDDTHSEQDKSDMRALVTAATPLDHDRRFPPSTPVLMIYTSGTTGLPKGALISQEALYHSALNSIGVFEMVRHDEVLTAVPMYHIAGLSIHSVPAMLAGATVTIHREFDAGDVLRDIERLRVTVLLARPVVSRAISSHSDWENTDISSLRTLGTGGTGVPLASMAPWFARGIPVQQLYGLTEAMPPVIAVPIEDARRKAGSIGKPSAHVESRIVDRWMRDVEPGERGEIALRGKCVFSEYWANPEATEQNFRDGWFMTGDVGHIDDDGYFYIDDRIKDIVIVGGSNIYPADGERILAECEAIEEAAIVGRPDPELGESIVACVVLKEGYAMTSKELRALFVGRLAVYQHPHHVAFMDSLPRTGLGKIEKSTLRTMVRGDLPLDAAYAKPKQVRR
ncbi:MAG: AMP-binding protein [Alphaproteobacteria bacterium]|nr:AMP-binding protein [Alphaproteobacteria bacterium]